MDKPSNKQIVAAGLPSNAVALLAIFASLLSFAWYCMRGEILLYGDAVAHINIARGLFDARTPGVMQIGTVWLPLPHLLQAPFLLSDKLWISGIGGSIPSMAAYVLGVVGIFRLLKVRALGGWAYFGAAVYGLNPSLLYMQATAMSESLFLCLVIWSVYFLDEYRRGLFPPSTGHGDKSDVPAWRSLERCGMCLAAAILTRYDGWVFAFAAGLFTLAITCRWLRHGTTAYSRSRILRSQAALLLLCALTGGLWLAHNYYVTGRPLDWFNGPYSAKAIEQRTTQPGAPGYPGRHSMKTAEIYFMKAAEMNMAEGWPERWILLAAALGTLVALFHSATYGRWLLLWLPLPFYAYSVAYGSVPIFLPVWWPCSYYNVRYGLELLPVFAVMLALAGWSFSGVRLKKAGPVVSWALIALVSVGYLSSWIGDAHTDWGVRSPKRGPLCYREAVVNSLDRAPAENFLSGWLKTLPPNATVMMNTSELVGALQSSGTHLSRVLNNADYIHWIGALSAPAVGGDYIVAINDDEVARAIRINPRGLEEQTIFRSSRGYTVRIYRSLLRGNR